MSYPPWKKRGGGRGLWGPDGVRVTRQKHSKPRTRPPCWVWFEQTRSSSHLHTNFPDTCTVKNACGFTACYPEDLLSYLAHAHAVDTRLVRAWGRG